MTAVLIIAAALATLAAALFAGYENGIYALSHVRLRYRLSLGDARARTVERLFSRPQTLLSGLLLAQNIVVYFATAVVTALFERGGMPQAELVSTVILAVFFFIAVEAIPKNIFRRGADTLVYAFARPLSWVLVALWPLQLVLRGVTALIRKIGAGEADVFNPFFTRERLAFYLREGQSEGLLSKYQVELTSNILRGERAGVTRAMVPLEKAVAVPAEMKVSEFDALAREKRFARYPVYRDRLDNVIGVLNIYDCYLAGKPEATAADLMRPAALIPADLHVTEALRRLREARTPMGIVADKTHSLGLVTMKDCVEEIVGELYAW